MTIVCVGKLKEAFLRDACAEYAKRLQAFCKLSVIEVDEARLPDNPSAAQLEAAIQDEGKRIAQKIPSGCLLIPLCIEGKELDSVSFSKLLADATVAGKSNVTLLIGGSYGLWQALKERADVRLSMSRMTFPHQLARVMLLEQIYRAFQINSNGRYHK